MPKNIYLINFSKNIKNAEFDKTGEFKIVIKIPKQ